MRWRVAGAVLAIALVAASGFAVYRTYIAPPGPPCVPVTPGSPLRSQLTNTTFGAVTEWPLPSRGRWPDAITTAPDGSIWFAEEGVPGMAHLYPGNGTLVEYAWPGYATPKTPQCSYEASSSGIALWEERVWAPDQYRNVILGLDPSDGSVVKVNTTSSAPYPYWLAVGPDGNLWFTSDNYPGVLGRIYPNLTLSTVHLNGIVGHDEPIELDMVNSSLALLSALDLSENSNGECVCSGHIYSFDPSTSSTNVTVTTVGGGYQLIETASLSYSEGTVWVTQHGPSSVLSYNFSTGEWTNYPTSLVPWSNTYPYVIYANLGKAWFNEHYANKIAVIDPSAKTLTEYSESDPPASTAAGVQNDVSIAPASDGLWFTSLTGNYVGLVSADYRPVFAVAPPANDTLHLRPGGTASVSLQVSGTRTSSLGVNVSDSENYGSVPDLIRIVPATDRVPAGSSPFSLSVQISAAEAVPPGDYTVAVTISDGLVQQTAYVFVDVG